jgi:hypothetical protein
VGNFSSFLYHQRGLENPFLERLLACSVPALHSPFLHNRNSLPTVSSYSFHSRPSQPIFPLLTCISQSVQSLHSTLLHKWKLAVNSKFLYSFRSLPVLRYACRLSSMSQSWARDEHLEQQKCSGSPALSTIQQSNPEDVLGSIDY